MKGFTVGIKLTETDNEKMQSAFQIEETVILVSHNCPNFRVETASTNLMKYL